MFTTCFYKFLKEFSHGYRLNLLLLLVSSFVAGVLEFFGIALIFPLIIVILKPETIQDIKYLSFLSESLNSGSAVVMLSIGVIGAFIIKNIFMILNARHRTSLLSSWQASAVLSMFKKYLYSSYQSKQTINEKYPIMQILYIVNNSFMGYVQRMLTLLTCAVILSVIFAFFVWKFKLWAILTCLFFACTGLVQNKFFKTKGRELNKKLLEHEKERNKSVMGAIRNLKDIKIFGRENYFYNKYAEKTKNIYKIQSDIEFWTMIPQNIVEICTIFAIVVMCYGIVSTVGGNPDEIIASLGVLAALMFRTAPLVNKLQVQMNYINATKPVLDELFRLNELYKQIDCHEYSTNEVQEFKTSITVKNLSFAYAEQNILENLNLSIQKGEFVGIIGASGVGKTTFVDVLMGLLTPRAGEVLADEEILAGKNLAKWINAIGYVPQEVTTLPVTIAQNVAFGVEEEEIDKARVFEALKQAQLEEYIAGLPLGIETELADVTQSLSQGQKQRIGIARALYKSPEILFLDEITSALDLETENKITDCLNALKGQKTIIAIAHRISTLKKCDRILYFKSKDTVLSGTFDELCAKDESFEQIIRLSAVNAVRGE